MKCFTCQTEMENKHPDYDHPEYKFFKCPSCPSKAEIYYDKDGEIIQVVWER